MPLLAGKAFSITLKNAQFTMMVNWAFQLAAISENCAECYPIKLKLIVCVMMPAAGTAAALANA